VRRRSLLEALAALATAGALPAATARALPEGNAAVSVAALPPLNGNLTLYLGRGEGGLYENVIDAIRERNPELELAIRRGPTAALANTIVAEGKAGLQRADCFWAVDSGAVAMVTDAGLARPLPDAVTAGLKPGFRYARWAPVTGRVRTLPFNTERLSADQVPADIMALADSDLTVGWAPAYGSFQSFVTAMRLLEGEDHTLDWLRGVQRHARSYAGELGVVMAVERGEVDLGLANHYYTLRLKKGKPGAKVDLAFTRGDAGCLVNASGVMALSEGDAPIDFIRYLLTREVQSYLASEAYELPLVAGVPMPAGLPPLSRIEPPEVDLTRLAALRPTLDLMRRAGVL